MNQHAGPTPDGISAQPPLMERRRLGHTGPDLSVLSFGAGTFGGRGPLFENWGTTSGNEARTMVDACLDAGVNTFDTSDNYSEGASEEVLGRALLGRRERAIISTKTGLAATPNALAAGDFGASASRLVRAVEASLRRLRTDHIDLLHLHAYDSHTPVEETLTALSKLVDSGKVGHLGASNYAGWQLMKSLATSDSAGLPRFVSHQVYYSLAGRDYEWDLMPVGLDQRVSAMVWSPLAWGRLTGKIRRGHPLPSRSRLHRTAEFGPPIDDEALYRVVDALVDIADETGHTVPQVALNWLTTRPTVASVIIGARTPEQLQDNLGATGWQLAEEHRRRLHEASGQTPPYPHYPYYRQDAFVRLSPPPGQAV